MSHVTGDMDELYQRTMRHVAHTNGSCYTAQHCGIAVESRQIVTWMSHVTHMNESP